MGLKVNDVKQWLFAVTTQRSPESFSTTSKVITGIIGRSLAWTSSSYQTALACCYMVRILSCNGQSQTTTGLYIAITSTTIYSNCHWTF